MINERYEDTNPEEAQILMEICEDNHKARRKGKPNIPTFLDVTEPIRSYDKINGIKKIGRNDPCPCQSGKKYKKCCGK